MCQNCPVAYNSYRPAAIVPGGCIGDWQRGAPGREDRRRRLLMMSSKRVASAEAPAFFAGRICSGRCSA
jgi:hypothetical protein